MTETQPIKLVGTDSYRYSVLTSAKEILAIKDEWESLHADCSVPSIYNSFGFVYHSIDTLMAEEASLHFLCVYRGESMVSLFPMQIYEKVRYRIRIKVIDYAAPHEADKPYPLFHSTIADEGWSFLFDYLSRQFHDWNLLQINELRAEKTLLEKFGSLTQSPKLDVQTLTENEAPIVRLDKSWDDFWNSHKKMRKKVRKVEKDFKDRVSFEIHSQDPDTILSNYIDLEQRSWKRKKKIGVSKHPDTIEFYRRFFHYLAKNNNLHAGFLKVDNEVISAEIAYTLGSQVYFSHGCYDERYANYSPGMVSTSHFLKHFFNENYLEGDYLCGFAGYMNDWADFIQPTVRLDILRKSPKTRLFLLMTFLRSKLIKPLKQLILPNGKDKKPILRRFKDQLFSRQSLAGNRSKGLGQSG